MYFNTRLWIYTAGFRVQIAVAVLFGLLTAAAGIARLALLGTVLAKVLQGEAVGELFPWIVAAAGSVVLRMALQYLKEMSAHRTAAAIQLSLRERLYSHAIGLGPAHYTQERTGDSMLTLVDGVEQLETFFGQYLVQLFTAALTPIGIFLYLLFLDVPTAIVALLFAVLTLFAPAVFHKWNQSSSIRRRDAYGEFGSEFLDSIQGLATLKAFGQGKARGQMLADRAHRVFRTTMWVLATNAGSLGLTIAGVAIGAAAVLTVSAVRFSTGDMSLAALVIVLMLGIEMFRPFREMSQLFHQGMAGLSASQGIFRLLDGKPAVDDASPLSGDPEKVDLEPSIEFRNVTFSYLGTDQHAIENVSFALQPGQRVGIAGESGAGKTSIIKLLLRFYDPQTGSVSLGGEDLREMSLERLRSQIAIVSQDTYLFHGTVIDNLRFGGPEAAQADLEQAAKLANAHDFITSLPNGYDTVIGERGVRLSGGQRQRIAIARALLRDAPLLVLDEALSAIDAENEYIIQEALDHLMEHRTTLVIAHRLSSLRNTDSTLVLERGRLVESGTHDELMAADGVYAALMAEQVEESGPQARSDELVQLNETAPAAMPAFSDDSYAGQDATAAQLTPTDAILKAEGMGWVTVSRVLFALISPWKFKLTLSFVTGVLRFITLIGVGVISALVVANLISGEPFGWLLIALFIMAPVSALLHWGENWVSHDVAFRLLSEMRIALYDKLEKLSPAYLVRRRTGDLVSMATQDVETVEYFFAHVVAPSFVAVVVPAGVLITLLVFGWPLALALLPFLLIVAVSPVVSRNRVDRLGSRSREHLGELNAHVVDTIQGIHEVAAFGRGPARQQEFVALAESYIRVRVPFFRELTLQKVFLEAATGLGGLVVAVVGASLVSDGSLDPGRLPLATLIAMSAFLPVSEIANIGRLLADTLGSTRRIYAVQLEQVPVMDGPGVPVVASRRGNAMSFSNVGFSYDYSNRAALAGVSFDVAAGQTVALVGSSGAGKTTAAHLVMRFWDPAYGRITLNGHNLRDYRLEELRKLIALVAQDTYLFNSTLRQNLLVAKPDAADDELDAAVDLAGLRSFVDSLPDGLDTSVGERGAKLSGGQKQRVAISRAFLKDASILILDEATSHLDATNERQVRRALDRLAGDRTTLVIAHRLSTVRNADCIVVLDGGRVAEVGRHDDLVAARGIYARLVASQMQSTLETR
jgi:ATP-binding cassette subfamily B protein